jgi:hypothetical protein
VYAISDIHVDYRQNLGWWEEWCSRLAAKRGNAFQVVIVPGEYLTTDHENVLGKGTLKWVLRVSGMSSVRLRARLTHGACRRWELGPCVGHVCRVVM